MSDVDLTNNLRCNQLTSLLANHFDAHQDEMIIVTKKVKPTKNINIESFLSTPKLVPEELKNCAGKHFKGCLLAGWYLSEFEENCHVHQLITKTVLETLILQFFTNLLAIGVLQQIPDENGSVYTNFKSNCTYCWKRISYAETDSDESYKSGNVQSFDKTGTQLINLGKTLVVCTKKAVKKHYEEIEPSHYPEPSISTLYVNSLEHIFDRKDEYIYKYNSKEDIIQKHTLKFAKQNKIMDTTTIKDVSPHVCASLSVFDIFSTFQSVVHRMERKTSSSLLINADNSREFCYLSNTKSSVPFFSLDARSRSMHSVVENSKYSLNPLLIKPSKSHPSLEVSNTGVNRKLSFFRISSSPSGSPVPLYSLFPSLPIIHNQSVSSLNENMSNDSLDNLTNAQSLPSSPILPTSNNLPNCPPITVMFNRVFLSQSKAKSSLTSFPFNRIKVSKTGSAPSLSRSPSQEPLLCPPTANQPLLPKVTSPVKENGLTPTLFNNLICYNSLDSLSTSTSYPLLPSPPPPPPPPQIQHIHPNLVVTTSSPRTSVDNEVFSVTASSVRRPPPPPRSQHSLIPFSNTNDALSSTQLSKVNLSSSFRNLNDLSASPVDDNSSNISSCLLPPPPPPLPFFLFPVLPDTNTTPPFVNVSRLPAQPSPSFFSSICLPPPPPPLPFPPFSLLSSVAMSSNISRIPAVTPSSSFPSKFSSIVSETTCVPPPPPLPKVTFENSVFFSSPPPAPPIPPPLPPPSPPPLPCTNLSSQSTRPPPPPLPDATYRSNRSQPPSMLLQHQTKLRKPLINPAAPMRPLYWSRIVIPLNFMDESPVIWNEIDELSLDNITEFVNLFSRQIINRKSSIKKFEGKTKIEPIKLLDSKKSHNVGILIQSLKIDIQEIENAVYSFDTSMVSLEALQQIYDMRANEEELKKIKLHLTSNPDVPLDKPEQFLYELSEISNFAERISCLIFHVEFDNAVSEIGNNLANIKTTCDILVNNMDLKMVLAIILTLGNYMNGGNVTRGQADGFGLEILSKLKDVKSKDSKITLLHYIVKLYIQECEKYHVSQIMLPVPEPGDIKRAASMDFDDERTKLRNLQKKLSECEVISEQILKASNVENSQPFKDKMSTFLDFSKKQLAAEFENLEECYNQFIATVKFYMLTPKIGSIESFPLNLFFELWLQFSVDFKDILKKELIRKERKMIQDLKKKETKRLMESCKTMKERENGLKAKIKRVQAKYLRQHET